jgi:hypothetical protein
MEKWNKPAKNVRLVRPVNDPFGLSAAKKDPHRYGKPKKLFGDFDKDRVPNVFDCEPRNPKKQDLKHYGGVIAPPRWGMGMTGMFQQRESTRRSKIAAAMDRERIRIAEADALRYQKELEELQRLNTPIVTKTTVNNPITYLVVDEKKPETITRTDIPREVITSVNSGGSGGSSVTPPKSSGGSSGPTILGTAANWSSSLFSAPKAPAQVVAPKTVAPKTVAPVQKPTILGTAAGWVSSLFKKK